MTTQDLDAQLQSEFEHWLNILEGCRIDLMTDYSDDVVEEGTSGCCDHVKLAQAKLNLSLKALTTLGSLMSQRSQVEIARLKVEAKRSNKPSKTLDNIRTATTDELIQLLELEDIES